MSRRKRRASSRADHSSENFCIMPLPWEVDGAYIIASISNTIINSVTLGEQNSDVLYEVEYKNKKRKTYIEFPPSTLNLPYNLKHKEVRIRREMEEISGLISNLEL